MASAPLTGAAGRDLLRHLSLSPPEKKPYQGGRPRSGSSPTRLAYSQETGQAPVPMDNVDHPTDGSKGKPSVPLPHHPVLPPTCLSIPSSEEFS